MATEINIGGNAYAARFDLSAMARVEEELGLTSMEEFGRAIQELSARSTIALIAAMITSGDGISFADAKALVGKMTPAEMTGAQGQMMAVFNSAMAVDTDAAAETVADPKAPARRRKTRAAPTT